MTEMLPTNKPNDLSSVFIIAVTGGTFLLILIVLVISISVYLTKKQSMLYKNNLAVLFTLSHLVHQGQKEISVVQI